MFYQLLLVIFVMGPVLRVLPTVTSYICDGTCVGCFTNCY